MEERIEIWRDASPLRVAGDFTAVVRSPRLPEILSRVASVGGAVIAGIAGDELRGYATLVPSSALHRERWEDLPDTFELGSIEVCRSSRRRGLGTALLARLSDVLPIEKLVLLARGMSCHWDVDAAAVNFFRYRRMLMGMLGRVGFRHWQTDDPEIDGTAFNFLAVRTGKEVATSSLLAFAERARHDPWG